MKKNNLLIIELTICLLSFCLSACSGFAGGTKSENLCTVSGTIHADCTIPLNNSRTATVTFEASETDVWSISATDGSKTRDGCIENGTYSISLPKGSWTIEAFLKTADDSILLYGSVELTVDSSYENLSDKNIVVAPKNDDGLTGSVKLSFKDESGKLSCVNCKIQDVEVESAIFNAQGLASLFIPSLSAASYEATLYFDDAAGNTLYSSNEYFNVFSNWQTNIWNLADNSETAIFTITQNMLDSYGTITVSNSTNVLYGNFHTDESEAYLYDYYFTDDLSAELPQGTSTQRIQDGKVNYCFDSNGDIYYFDYNAGTHTLKSTKEDFEVSSTGENSFNDFINIDRKTDILYSAHISDDNKKQITLYKYPNLLSEQSDLEKTSCIITGFASNLPTFCPFAIYDEVVYIAYLYYSNIVYFASVDISNVEDGGEIAISPALITIEGNLWVQPAIRDIIYQDSCVYFLFDNSYLTSDTLVASSGALVKYDTFTGQFSTCGMISEYQVLKAKFFAQVYEGEEYRVIYEDQECTQIRFVEKKFPVPPVSETLSTKYFYGPQRFVGIKPKKLVISDEGVAFYTDADGSNYYKNVNRVVIVDLETFAMESSYEVDASFNDDVTLKARTSFSTNDGANYYGSVYSVGPTVAGQSSFGIYVMGENGGESAKRVPYAGKIEFERRD